MTPKQLAMSSVLQTPIERTFIEKLSADLIAAGAPAKDPG
jgi:hypothetical protein